MALLCFLLDLRNIPPDLLHRLKQVRASLLPFTRFLSSAHAFVEVAELRDLTKPCVLRCGATRGILQCLLHLANLYAATTSPPHSTSAASAPALPDRLALVYVHHAASSSSPEVCTPYHCLCCQSRHVY